MHAKPNRNFLQIILMLAALAVSASGCASVADYSIEKISDLKPNQVLLVGKIELVPKFKKEEQIITPGRIYPNKLADPRNKINIYYKKKWEPTPGPTSFRITPDPFAFLSGKEAPYDRDSASVAWFKETFFAPLERGNYYIVRSFLSKEETLQQTGYRGTGRTVGALIYAFLPGGLKLTMQPSDKAVYVGTIRYYRDKNFDVRKIRIVDEYKKTLKEYKKRFPNKPPPLKKRLLTKVKGYKLKY